MGVASTIAVAPGPALAMAAAWTGFRVAPTIADSEVASGVLGLIISASLYERHLNRAVPTGLGPTPTWRLVTDPRGDPDWRRIDRRLTRGIRATAVLAGMGGATAAILWPIYRYDDSGINFTAGIPSAVLSVVSLIALGAQAAVRRKHRREIPAWPRLGVGGLMLRF